MILNYNIVDKCLDLRKFTVMFVRFILEFITILLEFIRYLLVVIYQSFNKKELVIRLVIHIVLYT